MKRYTAATLPASAQYIGSTEGPHAMSQSLADLLDDSTAPAFTEDEDGTAHYFELCPQDFQPRAHNAEACFL